MKNYTVIRVHKNEFGQACKVLDTFPDYTTAYFFISKMNRMYQTASLHFVIDAYLSLRALFLVKKKTSIVRCFLHCFESQLNVLLPDGC